MEEATRGLSSAVRKAVCAPSCPPSLPPFLPFVILLVSNMDEDKEGEEGEGGKRACSISVSVTALLPVLKHERRTIAWVGVTNKSTPPSLPPSFQVRITEPARGKSVSRR